MAKAFLITIGDELLVGQVIDTNSAWMAQRLNRIGVAVAARLAVGDSPDAIFGALKTAEKQAEIILITGGLGPTADDITKPVLNAYFGGKLIEDAGALENVTRLFRDIFKKPLTDRNRLQAQVPDVCEVLQNAAGTAPGMLFRKDGKVIVSMPGVPFEMQQMMETQVIPLLQREFASGHIIHKTLVTNGIGESSLADLVRPVEGSLPPHIKLAYLPNFGMVRLRLTGTGADLTSLEREVQHYFGQLKKSASEYCVAEEDLLPAENLGRLLTERKGMLCTAESCTGGYIAHQITQIPGSSGWFHGSVVGYSYEAKEYLLQVDRKTLSEKGAVSREVVLQMAVGALKNFRAGYVAAVSGIMGPGGGLPDKPVGTVWICAGDRERLLVKKYLLRFDREKNIQVTASMALNMLRDFLTDSHLGTYETFPIHL